MTIEQLCDEIIDGDKVFLDSETCGLFGIAVLLQWAVDDGDIHLYDVFKETFGDTLQILETLVKRDIIGFNLTFDCFHLVKLYTIWREVVEQHPELRDALPEDHISTIEKCEEPAQEQPCWKARNLCDLMLHSRKGKYQSLMSRSDVRIRRVPTALAYVLAEELEQRVEIPDIYFSRFKDKDRAHWQVYDIDDEVYFKDVVLKFAPSGSLKALAEHALGVESTIKFQDIEIDKEHLPFELGYAPTARASREHIMSLPAADRAGKWAWPDKVRKHIDHWWTSEKAREYAELDIVYTRDLYYHLDEPEIGDDDSELAGCVAAVRWRGYELDLEGIEELQKECLEIIEGADINVNSTDQVRTYLNELLDPLEQVIIAESTRKENIKTIANWENLPEDEEPNLEAAKRAKHILKVRDAHKASNMYGKLLLARKLHASFKVIGTKSSRMSGADNLNVQAVDSRKTVRQKFPLARKDEILVGGDFASFELSIADAEYQDEEFHRYLTTSEVKLQTEFATILFPPNTIEDVEASKGTDNDLYTKGKACMYAKLYFGTPWTFQMNQGVTQENAEEAFEWWEKTFPQMTAKTNEIAKRFKPVEQMPHGGFKWHDPDDFVETKDGFKRYFTLENRVAKALFDLGMNPPKGWRKCKEKVARRDRLQTAAGATMSALIGACFSILNQNVRAAGNHKIQSFGATSCKKLHRRIWDIQPSGCVEPFKVCPCNIHDEIMCPTAPDEVDEVFKRTEAFVESLKPKVPLVAIDMERLESWADK